MVKHRSIAIISLILALSSPSTAQEKTERYEAGFQYHYGFLWSHRSSLEVLDKGYIHSFELSFYRKFSGKEDWELKYKYPYVGYSFMYFDFGNPGQMGYGYSLFAYYDFPLAGNQNNSLDFKIGLGPGYVTKVFERNENIKHYGLSTKLNGFAQLSLKGRFRLYKGLKLQAGIALSHFSNASFKKPNLGINLPTATAGLTYGFSETQTTPKKEKSEYVYDKAWKHDIIFNYGMREKNPIGGDRYNVWALAYNASRSVTFKSRLGAGFDIFYNSSLKGQLTPGNDTIRTGSDILQLGISAIYSLDISHVSIVFNPGYYFRSAYRKDGSIYSRFAFRYRIGHHYIANLGMITHFAVADHVEFGIGYRF